MKGLNSLNLSQKLWLFAAGCFMLIAYLGYNFYETEYVVYSQQVESLDSEIRLKKGELRQILAQKQRLKDLEAEIEQANQEFARLQEMFPDEEIIPRRLIDLTAVTRKSLTVPTKFLPLRVEEKEFYKENHYAITISSSYHALGMLFGEVANFRYPDGHQQADHRQGSRPRQGSRGRQGPRGDPPDRGRQFPAHNLHVQEMSKRGMATARPATSPGQPAARGGEIG